MRSVTSFPDLRAHLAELFVTAQAAVAPGNDDVAIVIERPKQAQHGDYSCNLALQLAKRLKRNPREVATALIAALPASPHIAKTEIAGAGFINLFLHPVTRQAVVPHVLAQGYDYGTRQLSQNQKVQVEFVSANPTGPLHVGHGRGAAYGASLANLLTATGHQVTREYYINDAGRQMDILALSTWLRYLELHDVRVAFPSNGYQGAYVVEMAQSLQTAHGNHYLQNAGADELLRVVPAEADRETHLDALIAHAKQKLGVGYAELHRHVLTAQLADLRGDLAEFGVDFDVWFSEQSLFENGRVAQAVARLDAAGHLFEQAGARWFRSTSFGDEKDRVVQRDNGQYTYFASDIAYHLDKFERGFDRIIDIWGADHHGYMPRVKGALQALGLPAEKLDIALVQFAVLYRGQEKVSMSTRAGEFVTLRELRQEVGNDAARFFYVLRKSDQHLDFDLELAKAHTNDNPVYYIQYAHARVCSALGQWGGDIASLADANFSLLNEPAEVALLSRLIDYPDVMANAARDLAPHAVAFYLKDLAADFHSYYNATRLLVDDAALKHARLALAVAARTVIRNGLALLGVSAPEKM
jgi:arginyl-tRNA synthetase